MAAHVMVRLDLRLGKLEERCKWCKLTLSPRFPSFD